VVVVAAVVVVVAAAAMGTRLNIMHITIREQNGC